MLRTVALNFQINHIGWKDKESTKESAGIKKTTLKNKMLLVLETRTYLLYTVEGSVGTVDI